MAERIEIVVGDLTGVIYNTNSNPDKYCFELGGFYNWYLPFDECLEKAKEQMIRVATLRINSKFKAVKMARKREAISLRKAALAYLSLPYFDEVVYRIENADGHVIIGVDDPEKWLAAFKEAKPWIKSINLEHIKSNRYYVSANI